MRVLHAIHDFLPRHRAGSEIYADELCQTLLAQGEDVWLLATDYDLGREHGSLVWRTWRDLPIIELINNWAFRSFEETWHSPLIAERIAHVLDVLAPDVVHIHNLLNLTFELPRLCRQRGIPTVATLHDYTLVCPSGGQRVHQAERHICREIDTERCARCFRQHNFHGRLVYGSLGLPGAARGARPGPVRKLMRVGSALLPQVLSRMPAGPRISADQMSRRLEAARRVLEEVDLWVAPSRALAHEYLRLGLDPSRIEVSDYGFVARRFEERSGPHVTGQPLRVGFVGTLVWHKGAHVLVEALALLSERLPEGSFEAHLWGARETFPDYTAQIERAAEGLPVHLHGGFDSSQLAEVYGSFDVLIVASLWPENSPLVIHEAQMAGVPVVGAEMGGIPGLVEAGKSGLLYDAYSADALARQLSRLIEQPDLLDRLRKNQPEVKTIEQDALDWQQRYQRALDRGLESPSDKRPAHTGTVAVVLNYRTAEDTVIAVRSLLHSRTPLRAVLVVDNRSEDRSAKLLERRCLSLSGTNAAGTAVELLLNEHNLGFSGGCNVGITRALELGADSVLLVNPDVVILPDTLARLRSAIFGGDETTEPQPGIAAPLLLGRADPRRVISAGLAYSPLLGRMRHLEYGTAHEDLPTFARRRVDAVAGCAMLVRSEIFEQAGLLREDFFFSFEDIEFCLRARRHGWSSLCVGEATALHEGSLSMRVDDPLRLRYAVRNHLLLARSLESSASLSPCLRWSIVGLNVLHALLAGGRRRRERLAAVLAGVRDFGAERFGQIH